MMHVFPIDLSFILYFQEISKYERKTTKGEVSINNNIHIITCPIVSGFLWKELACFCSTSYAFRNRLFSLGLCPSKQKEGRRGPGGCWAAPWESLLPTLLGAAWHPAEIWTRSELLQFCSFCSEWFHIETALLWDCLCDCSYFLFSVKWAICN